MPQADFRVGPQVDNDGMLGPPRLGRTGEVNVSDVHGVKYESVYRGGMFSASSSVAGVAPGTVLSTTPPCCLYNPLGSGKNLVLDRITLGYVSGTLGAGFIAIAQVLGQTTIPTGGTVIAGISNQVGNGASGVGKIYQGSTLIAVPTIIRPSPFNFGAFTAATAVTWAPMLVNTEGEYIVIPGGALVLQGVMAAGTSPLVVFGLQWEEVAQ
jgi:hypothetical protein